MAERCLRTTLFFAVVSAFVFVPRLRVTRRLRLRAMSSSLHSEILSCVVKTTGD